MRLPVSLLMISSAIFGGVAVLLASPHSRPGSTETGHELARLSPLSDRSTGTASKQAFIEHLSVPARLGGSRVDALREEARAVLSSPELLVDARATQYLSSGHEFPSSLALRATRRGKDETVTFTVTRAGGGSVKYEVELEDGELGSARITRPGSGAERRPLVIRGDEGPSGRGLQHLAIGIGDLPLQDALALLKAAADSRWTPAGYLERPGSRKQLVFEVDLNGGHGAPEGLDAGVLVGTSALLYLDEEAGTIRSLRIFDPQDRLLRLYGDFIYEGRAKDSRLSSFSVRSIPDQSYTRLELDRLEARD